MINTNFRDNYDAHAGLSRTRKATVLKKSKRDPITISIDGVAVKKDAYYKRTDLYNVVIPEGVTHIERGAFSSCKRLRSVTLPQTLESIGDYAFDGCKSLKSIVIPDSVSSIGEGAFRDCKRLRKVTLSDNLIYVGDLAFNGCFALDYNEITTDKRILSKYLGSRSNPYFMSFYCSDTFLHSDTKILYAGTFKSSYDKYILLPNGLVSICKFAFFNSGVENITIPQSVKHVSEVILYNCSSIKFVKYYGTKDEWQAVFGKDDSMIAKHRYLQQEIDIIFFDEGDEDDRSFDN